MVWQPRADHEQKQELGDVTITRGLDATRPITEALPGHVEVRQQPEALLAMWASDRRNEPFEHAPDDGAPHGW